MVSLTPAVREFLSTGTRTGKLGYAASDGRPLAGPVMDELRRHRWDRWIDIP